MWDPQAEAIKSPFVRQPHYNDLLADLMECEPHLRTLARLCEACEGSGEIVRVDDYDNEEWRRCEHCRPIWDLAERINPSPPPPESMYEEVDDDIPF